MKKKRARPTAEDWARWKEASRQLAERVEIVDRQIAAAKKREQSA